MSRRFWAVVVVSMLVAGALLVAQPGASAKQHGPDGPCRNMSRACKIEVANTYMDAQAGGFGTREGMRLASDVHRWENAILNATNADQLRASSPAAGPAGSEVWSQRDRDRIWVDGNQVFSIWIVDVRTAPGEPFSSTAHIFERLQVERRNCEGPSPCVQEVEAIFCNVPHGLDPAQPTTTPDPRPSALCFRAA